MCRCKHLIKKAKSSCGVMDVLVNVFVKKEEKKMGKKEIIKAKYFTCMWAQFICLHVGCWSALLIVERSLYQLFYRKPEKNMKL